VTPIYRHDFRVSEDTIDENGHANNVAYVQWMQDVAVLHSDAAGCTRATRAVGATWVVRSHRVKYLRPALLGDSITALTWVVNFRKVMSLRRYKFLRANDSVAVATGETDWVFVDLRSGQPRKIPEDVRAAFQLVPEDPFHAYSG